MQRSHKQENGSLYLPKAVKSRQDSQQNETNLTTNATKTWTLLCDGNTPYSPDENFPAGNYLNQNPGGEGLPQWTEADRPVENTDVVVWYTFAHSHSPRAEDWPVMPVANLGFKLKPLNFFDENPSNDVPPSPKNHGSQQACCHSSEARCLLT